VGCTEDPSPGPAARSSSPLPSLLQGIALQVDPDYSIVKECFPYLSRRLLTDDDPRARKALKELLFAGGEHISLARLERLTLGLSSFTVEGLGPNGSGSQQKALQMSGGQQVAAPVGPMLDSTAKEVLAAVFSERPTYVQELLVQEAVGTVDAAARQLASLVLAPLLSPAAMARVSAMQSMRGQLGQASLTPLGLLSK
jgi:aarF domain-containing kinase